MLILLLLLLLLFERSAMLGWGRAIYTLSAQDLSPTYQPIERKERNGKQ